MNNKFEFMAVFVSPRIVEELGVSAAVVFGDILYCCHRFGYYDASYSQIEEKLGYNQKAFGKIKKRLIDAGYITSKTKLNGRGHVTKLTEKAQPEALAFEQMKQGVRPDLNFTRYYPLITEQMLDQFDHPSKKKKAINMAYMLAHLAYKCGYSSDQQSVISDLTTYKLAKELGFSIQTAKATLQALTENGFIQVKIAPNKALTITPTRKMKTLNIINVRMGKSTKVVAVENPVHKLQVNKTEGVEVSETEGVCLVKLRGVNGETEGVPNVFNNKTNVIKTIESQIFVENPKSSCNQLVAFERYLQNRNLTSLAKQVNAL